MIINIPPYDPAKPRETDEQARKTWGYIGCLGCLGILLLLTIALIGMAVSQ